MFNTSDSEIKTKMVGMEQARKELSSLIKDLNINKVRYLLSARGKPEAVLLSVDDYLKNLLRQNRSRILADIQIEAKKKRLNRMTMGEINGEIKAYRDEKRRK